MKVRQLATIAAAGSTLLLGHARAQTNPRPMGTVPASDASVVGATGALVKVVAGRVELAGSSTVTAYPGRNAEVTLTRGGAVRVCQTSTLHATESSGDSLLLALDRGALEIRTKAGTNDVVLTPDLRLTPASAGPLDLQMRVSRNGDTCVDNRGHKAPTITISDTFGEASYQVKPNQHVLFEHGSLREVVDRETTPCGCPPETQPGQSLAEALLSGKGPKAPTQEEASHPFPIAQSEGLAEPAPVAPETSGSGTHVQVAATLTYNSTAPPAPATSAPAETPVAPPVERPQVQAAPVHHGPFAAVGSFFKRLFVR